MNVVVLIPTIKGREPFLRQAISLIEEQTYQPKQVIIVDDEPEVPGIDVAWRYLKGIERCKKAGADIIIFWEDDDWYKYNYIELMIKHWILQGHPFIFGLRKTIYYNIVKRKYLLIEHPGRASMMSTMVTKEFMPNWNEEHDQYVDMTLWKQRVPKSTMDNPFESPIAIGIKHGIGSTAGGGHKWQDNKFPYGDQNLTYLSSIVDKDSLNFYSAFYGKTRF